MEDFSEHEKLLDRAKASLFVGHGSAFLGSLMCDMVFKWSREIPTAAVDGLTLWWNPDFFMKLRPTDHTTILAHELWHVAFLHMLRGLGLDPDIHNQAADHVINLMLEEAGYDMTGFPYLKDNMFKGWSTDDVYQYLIDNLPPPPPMGGLGSDLVEPKDQKIADAITAEIVTKVVAASVSARMADQAGDIPGEISLVINEFLNPKLPWYTILYRFFEALIDQDYSMSRPNRRFVDELMLPSLVGTTGLQNLVYFLDISGSVSDAHILRFNSEVAYIKREFNPELLTLVTFDTKIRDVYTFEKDDPFEKIIVTGRGGTNLNPVMEYAKKLNPDAMIIFTDMYVSIPPVDPQIPLIWIALNSKVTSVPYGQLIHLKD
jgi:predicted metal-dependent peptidase